MANPAFAVAVVLVPVAALGYAVTLGTVQQHLYVHVMTGIIWTGVDVFMGLVLGPVVAGLDDDAAADFFRRFTPKAAFLLPSVATVTVFGGISLAARTGLLPTAEAWYALFTLVNVPGALLLLGHGFEAWGDRRWQTVFAGTTLLAGAWVAATVGGLVWPSATVLVALVIVTVLNLQGFGVILPGEVRSYQELRSPSPDTALIARIGRRNARLGGIQGALQFTIIVVMVYLRYGGLPTVL